MHSRLSCSAYFYILFLHSNQNNWSSSSLSRRCAWLTQLLQQWRSHPGFISLLLTRHTFVLAGRCFIFCMAIGCNWDDCMENLGRKGGNNCMEWECWGQYFCVRQQKFDGGSCLRVSPKRDFVMFYDVYKSFSYSISVGDLHLRVTTSSLDTVDSAQVSGLSPLRKTVHSGQWNGSCSELVHVCERSIPYILPAMMLSFLIVCQTQSAQVVFKCHWAQTWRWSGTKVH